jgi:allantoate deiminase
MLAATRDLVRWLDELGRISDESGRLTRTFLSPAMRRANKRVAGWMRGAGLSVREDAVGNVFGRLEPGVATRLRPTKTLVLGSHLDTVRDAGRFDGALGVLLPLVALRELRRRKVELPFAIEVVGFSEEEGVRFGSAYLGSKGYTGQLAAADLRLRDPEGISVGAAMQRWSRGGTGASVRDAARAPRPQQIIGYLEVHIEQGPVLEKRNLAVGVVSAIAGQTRGRMTFRGKAGHAGTTPMDLRRDALAGAAEFISFAEALARASAPLVATVGSLTVTPGIGNVIAGEATLSLDVRHPRDGSRRAALRLLLYGARAIARRRRLGVVWEQTQDHGAVACAPRLTAELDASIRAVQRRTVSLVSGAGHDAVVMSTIAPVAMLFVRCRDGLSHHPDEHASAADIDVALRVTVNFLQRLAAPAVIR